MLAGNRRKSPMDWTPSVTLATRPRTHARRRLPLTPATFPAHPEPWAMLVEGPEQASTHAPSTHRRLPISLPVPPTTKTDTPPVTPAPARPEPFYPAHPEPVEGRAGEPCPAPSAHRGLPISLPVPPPLLNSPLILSCVLSLSKGLSKEPVTPAPLRSSSETPQIQTIAASAHNVVISDHEARIYHDDIVLAPDTATRKYPQMSSFLPPPHQHTLALTAPQITMIGGSSRPTCKSKRCLISSHTASCPGPTVTSNPSVLRSINIPDSCTASMNAMRSSGTGGATRYVPKAVTTPLDSRDARCIGTNSAYARTDRSLYRGRR